MAEQHSICPHRFNIIILTSLQAAVVVLDSEPGSAKHPQMLLVVLDVSHVPAGVAAGRASSPGAGGGVDPSATAFIASPNDSHTAPSVMVWLADYFDVEVRYSHGI